MKKLYLSLGIICLLLLTGTLQATDSPLSEEAEISLLTASPGAELYAVFGHSALWVHDPVNNIDEVYNWGTFDFDTPNFYTKFMRGRLMYELTVVPLRLFLPEYDYAGRGVEQQVLNLTPPEKQAVYRFLQINRRPENIQYLYDFFYDNCATRIRDLADEQLDIDWGPEPRAREAKTFRELLHPYVEHIPWTSFGIDLLLGMPADKTASLWHYMFLPDEMFIAFQQARHNDGRLLINSHQEILPQQYQPSDPTPFTPTLVLWLVFILGCLTLLRHKLANIFQKGYFTILGVLGLLLFFMWFLSDHVATGMNLDLVWTLPTHIYFIFRTRSKQQAGMVKGYFAVVFFLNIGLLILWPFGLQAFHPASLPLILLATIFAGRVWIK